MRSLPDPHAAQGVNLSGSKCSPVLCPPHKIYFRTTPFILPSQGVWGLAPMFKSRPWPFPLGLALFPKHPVDNKRENALQQNAAGGNGRKRRKLRRAGQSNLQKPLEKSNRRVKTDGHGRK